MQKLGKSFTEMWKINQDTVFMELALENTFYENSSLLIYFWLKCLDRITILSG